MYKTGTLQCAAGQIATFELVQGRDLPHRTLSCIHVPHFLYSPNHQTSARPFLCCRLHLLAVTLDGRRVFFSTSAGGGMGFGATTTGRGNPRPMTLRAEIARQAPPQPGAPTTGRMAGHGAAPPPR